MITPSFSFNIGIDEALNEFVIWFNNWYNGAFWNNVIIFFANNGCWRPVAKSYSSNTKINACCGDASITNNNKNNESFCNWLPAGWRITVITVSDNIFLGKFGKNGR